MFDELMTSTDAWLILLLTTWFNYGQHLLFNNLEVYLKMGGKSTQVANSNGEMFISEASQELFNISPAK